MDPHAYPRHFAGLVLALLLSPLTALAAGPARANGIAPLDGHGGLVFFPDGTLNGDRDVGSFFFIGQPGGG